MKNIHEHRIEVINDLEINSNGKYILYYCTQTFREHWNHSLEYAVGLAEQEECGVVLFVRLDKNQEYWTERHVKFHLEGLQDFKTALGERDIKLVFRIGNLKTEIKDVLEDSKAVVTDFAYLNEDLKVLSELKELVEQKLIVVESNTVVPVRAVSDKQEYAARTLRPKIMDIYEEYIEKPISSSVPKSTKNYRISSDDISSVESVIKKLTFSEHTDVLDSYKGGHEEAKKRLDSFLNNHLEDYDDNRQTPTDRAVSEISMYLRNGHIAPSYILSRLLKKNKSEDRDSYLEELLVRRELAYNFVYFCKEDYDKLNALPDWAQETLEDHKEDNREYSYSRKEFEEGETHDDAWNESMRRMKETGYLHNHMRMFWGKQVLAWSNTPQYAHKTLLYLNNKYFLDGNDPNSYANALWVFGLHDRAWGENEVFGKVRKMNKSGLKNKIDVDKYIEQSKE